MVLTIFETTKAQSILRSERLIAERGKVLYYRSEPDRTTETVETVSDEFSVRGTWRTVADFDGRAFPFNSDYDPIQAANFVLTFSKSEQTKDQDSNFYFITN